MANLSASDIARLQALADAQAGAGTVTVKAASRQVLLLDLDRKGRNRAASWTKCSTCNGAREVQDTIGLWDDCQTCGGEGMVMGAVPMVTVPVLQLVAGNVTHELPLLAGAGHADQWTALDPVVIDSFIVSSAKAHAKKG